MVVRTMDKNHIRSRPSDHPKGPSKGGHPIGRAIPSIMVVVILALSSTTLGWQPCAPTDIDSVADPFDHFDPPTFEPDPEALLSGVRGTFLENLGQMGDGAGRFYIRGTPLSVAFGEGWVAYDYQPASGDQGVYIKVRFEGAHRVVPEGTSPLRSRTDFFIGNDPGSWITGARSFEEIVYRDIYDGIDLRFHLEGPFLKYEFIVSTGRDPSDIMMRYEGVDGLSIDGDNGDLLIGTPMGALRDIAPVTYQERSGTREVIPSTFRVVDTERVSFDIGTYDPSSQLVVDPGLVFSTYVGGSGNEVDGGTQDGAPMLIQMEVDEREDIHIAGSSVSTDFPVTPGGYNNSSGATSAVVFKLSSDGSDLLYSAHIGGSGGEVVLGLELDDMGNALVMGASDSTDFPVTDGVVQGSNAGGDDFVVFGINTTGSGLLFSTYLGGRSDEYQWGGGIELDKAGNIILGGSTKSSDFPTVPGCLDTTFTGSIDGFVTVMDPNCTKLISSTFLGGTEVLMEGDYLIDIAVEDDGNILCVGGTSSPDFPTTPDAFQATMHANAINGFLTRLDSNLTAVGYSTYVDGGAGGYLSYIDIDGEGYVYASGTSESGFPTTMGAYDTTNNGIRDCVLVKFTKDLTDLEYGTFVGGSANDGAGSIDVDELGRVHFVFCTASNDVQLTSDAEDTARSGFTELVVGCLAADGGSMEYCSYFGGPAGERLARGIFRGRNSTVIAGSTGSQNFPTTPGAYQRTNNGGADFFITRLWTGQPADADPPSPPRNVMARIGDRTVSLSWDPPADWGGAPILGYHIHRGDTEETMVPHDTVMGTEHYGDVPDRFGRSLYYAVTAFNFKHTSDLSEVVNVTPYGSPMPPDDLVANSVDWKVVVSWTPPADTGGLPIEGYVIGRGETILGLEDYERIGNVTEFIDENVTLGVTYTYRVRAFNSFGEGRNTTDRSVTPMGVPARIPVLRVTPGDGLVTLDWSLPPSDGGSMLLGFRLFRGSAGDAIEEWRTIDPSTSYLEDRQVTNGETYYYSVTAWNEVGDGPLSDVLAATPLGRPGMPFDLDGNGSDRRVELSWASPSVTGGAKQLGYRIYRGLTEDGLTELGTSDGPSYVDAAVENGVNYLYRVTAFNDLWEGDPSLVISVKPLAPCDLPGALSAVSEPGKVVLVWAPPEYTGGAPLSMYRVYRGVSGGGMQLLVELPPSSLRYEDASVEGGVTYYYYVVGVTEEGEGNPTATVEGSTVGLPGAPMGLEAVAGAGIVDLTWAAPLHDGGIPIIRFVVYRGTSETDLEPLVTLGYQLSYADEAVEGEVTYHYRVLAGNDVFDGPMSDLVSARPWWPPRLPGAPRALEAKVIGTSAHLSWMAPEDDGNSTITLYVILRGLSPSDLVELVRIGPTPSYVDEGLERGRTYYYSVAALNIKGMGESSQVVNVRVKTGGTTGPQGPWWVMLALLGILVAGTLSVVSTETGRYRWGLLLGPLTTRLKREEVLDNKTRHALLGIIIANPGIHYNALMREFDLKNGVAAYHLSVLEEKDYIRSVRDGRLKRFYSVEAKVPRDQRLTPEEIRETIVELVESNPGISQRSIVNELGINDDTVGYHLRSMVESGELNSAKRGRYTVYTRET